MNSFFADHIPTLLLFDFSDAIRLFAGLFVVMFFVVFVFLAKKYRIFEASASSSGGRRRFAFVGVVLLGVCLFVLGFGVERYRSIAEERAQQSEEYILLGEQRSNAGGKVLGEEDIADSEESPFVPKSQNFRLGSIAVGGDNQLYLVNTENRALELFSIGYKTVIEENRENTGAIVKWQTNKPSKGVVKYRKASDTDYRTASESSFGFEHTIVLEKLGYSGTYVFYIETQDKWGNTVKSENYALYSGSDSPSLFDLLAGAFGDIFGWAMVR